jgi:hypothetical protein
MMIHITNYLGNDSQANKTGTTIKQSRERTLGLVLDALSEHWQDVDIVIWNQQPYQPKNKNIAVINTNPKPVAQARNEILQDFYTSDDDWCAIFDNDIGVYHDDKDRLDTIEFISNPNKILNQLTGKVAAFAPFFPQQTTYEAIKEKNGRWISDVLNNWLFLPTIHLNGLVFHSNYKKLFGKEFYYDETLDIMEDADFAIQLNQAGLFVGKFQNVFMKEYSNKSTIFKTEPTFTPYKNRGPNAQPGKWDWDDRLDRNARMELAKAMISKKYNTNWEELYPKTTAYRLVKENSQFAKLFQ